MAFESDRPSHGFLKFDKNIKHTTKMYLEEFTYALMNDQAGPMQYWKRKLELRVLALEKSNSLRHTPKHYTGRPQKGRKPFKKR